MGHSTGSGARGNSAAAERYRRQAEYYGQHAERSPNNRMYQDEAMNYGDLAEFARRMRPNAKEYIGPQAAIALDDAIEGDEFEISGNVFSGRYRLERRRDPLSGQAGLMFVQQGRFSSHAFAKNTDTILSELRLIRGGRLENRESARVRKVKT